MTLTGTVNASDCPFTNGRYDEVKVYLGTGATMTVSAATSSITTISIGGASSLPSTAPSLSFTTETNGFYSVRLISPGLNAPPITYSLTIQ
jgi:hypothetical protein